MKIIAIEIIMKIIIITIVRITIFALSVSDGSRACGGTWGLRQSQLLQQIRPKLHCLVLSRPRPYKHLQSQQKKANNNNHSTYHNGNK